MKPQPLDRLAPGQVVAKTITTTGGMVLVRPGTVLTEKAIARLADLGIQSVCVEGPDDAARPLEEQLRELDERFEGHDGDRLMMQLKAIVAGQLRRQAGGGRG